MSSSQPNDLPESNNNNDTQTSMLLDEDPSAANTQQQEQAQQQRPAIPDSMDTEPLAYPTSPRSTAASATVNAAAQNAATVSLATSEFPLPATSPTRPANAAAAIFGQTSSPLRYPESPAVNNNRNATATTVNVGASSTAGRPPFPSSAALFSGSAAPISTQGLSQSQRSRLTSTAPTPRPRRGDINNSNYLNRMLRSTTNTPMQGTPQQEPARARPQIAVPATAGPTEGAAPTDPNAPVRMIYGTTVNVAESVETFKRFIRTFTLADKFRAMTEEDPTKRFDILPDHEEPLYPRLLAQLKAAEVFSMNLDCSNLKYHQGSEKLYKQLVTYPQEIIPLMDFTLTEVYMSMFEDVEDDFAGLRVRPFNLGRSVNMRLLNPSDIDQLITVKGLMIRSSPVIPDLKQAFFRCQVCDGTTTVSIDRGKIDEPTRCPRPECGTQNMMRLVHNRSVFSDRQVCRLQETPDEVPAGQTPHTVTLLFYDDLVDVAKPGDRLEITGVYRSVPIRANPRQRALNNIFKNYVDVVHIRKTSSGRLGVDKTIVSENEYLVNVEEDDRLRSIEPAEEARFREFAARPDLFEMLSRSIGPGICGMEDVKKGALLQLFGGTSRLTGKKTGSPRVRGDINILLVGDPGVSKSQILSYVHRLAPRGIYTSGKGSSAVGLTAYITKDPDTRQLVLESGALVLSDGGICCIDEFDKMSDSTRSVLHEVMEQQTVSVAKAGIITTLNARTSILAVANPIHSKFDPKLPIMSNINLPPTLISRFDLLYILLDKPHEEDDRRLAKHLLKRYKSGVSVLNENEYMKFEDLAKYITFARNAIDPLISEEAGNLLVEAYVKLRHSNNRTGKTYTATTRQLESLIRLSEAHARMRLSETVTVSDVEEANRLLLTAMQSSAIDPNTGMLDIDMINTGISARTRQVHSDKVREIKNLVMKQKGTLLKFMDLYRQFVEQSSDKITEREFLKCCEELEDQGSVIVQNRNKPSTEVRVMKLGNF